MGRHFPLVRQAHVLTDLETYVPLVLYRHGETVGGERHVVQFKQGMVFGWGFLLQHVEAGSSDPAVLECIY